jgi:hypothetical protein
LQAQRIFGAAWDIPDDQQTALQHLQEFQEMGISLVEIDEEPSPAVWEAINNSGLSVYANLGIRFPVPETFANADSGLINHIQTKASAYLSQSSVQALGLFEYGATDDPAFNDAIRPFVQQLKKTEQIKIYYTDNRDLSRDSLIVDFVMYDTTITSTSIESLSLPNQPEIGAFRFSPTGNLFGYVKPFKEFLNATSGIPQKPIFFRSDWLFSVTDKYPEFGSRLSSLSTDPEAVFALPQESIPAQKESPIPIIVLLVVWGTVALHYNTSPLYRKSLFRYFVGHKFFIEDIFQRHIRSPYTALIIIFQNMLIVSAAVFATFSALWSPLGMEAFFYYFPSLGLFGNHPISLFVWTCLGILVFSLVCILWLFLFHKGLRSLTQVITIYAWPLQVNFIFGTVAIALFASESSNLLIIVFALLAITMTLLGFIFASIDAAKHLRKKSQLYLLGTSGIYLILLGAFLAWLITNEYWQDIIKLTLRL